MTFATEGGIEWEKDTYYRTITIRPASSPASGYNKGRMVDHSIADPSPWTIAGESGYYKVKIESGVTNIGTYSFYNCTGLVGDLYLPDGILSIGGYSFQGCSNLKSLRLPSTAVDVGHYAFDGCTGIKGALTLPTPLIAIRQGAFRNCSGLTGTLTIPSTVTVIEMSVFFGCSGFSNVIFKGPKPSSTWGSYAFCLNNITPAKTYKVESYGKWTQDRTVFPEYDYTKWQNDDWIVSGGIEYKIFNDTKTLSIRSTDFPDEGYPKGRMREYTDYGPWGQFTTSGWKLDIQEGVVRIGSRAFKGSTGFTNNISLPSTLNEIGVESFCGCTGLKGTLTIPDGVYSIMGSAFEYCSSLTGLNIGSSFTRITAVCFRGCTGLTTLTIPNTVTEIGSSAFMDCTGLTGTLTIPSSITSVSVNAFYNCPNLSKVVINCPKFTKYPDMFNLNPNAPEKTYGLSSVNRWVQNRNWFPEFTYTKWKNLDWIVSGGIEYMIFEDTKTLAVRPTEYMESGYTSGQMKNYTDNGPWGTITEDGWTLELHPGITNIGNYAFQGCSGFTNKMDIPDSVTSIGDHAFDHCEQLYGEVGIPSGVTNIGEYAFRYCEKLTGPVTIPNGVTEIKEGIFTYCGGIQGPLTIPDGITSIGDEAFSNCPNLATEIDIPEGVTYIGMSAFYGCANAYGSLTLPSTLTTLETMAFLGCKNIRNVYFDCPEIPIGDDALNLNSGGDPRLYYAFGSWIDETKLPSTVETVWAFNMSPSVVKYNAADGWKATELKMNNGTEWKNHQACIKIQYT